MSIIDKHIEGEEYLKCGRCLAYFVVGDRLILEVKRIEKKKGLFFGECTEIEFMYVHEDCGIIFKRIINNIMLDK